MTAIPQHAPTEFVPVDGGDLAYEIRQSDTEPVLLVHGISSQRRLWNWLAVAAPEITLLAPDLRGRGDSVAVAGASGVDQHVHDLVALLDARGLAAVHVCGMSMGGFVAMRLAELHPGRVRSLILVDGGFPMSAPAGLTRQSLPAMFADRLARLATEWSDVSDYAQFFVANTAPLLDANDPLLLDNLAHDLGSDGRVRLDGAALLADAADIFFAQHTASVGADIRFLHAEWSVGAGSTPAYPAAAVESFRTRSSTLIPGVDHAGSIMTATGAAATAAALRDALAA